jgi:cytochrome b involved in lipid metabolism
MTKILRFISALSLLGLIVVAIISANSKAPNTTSTPIQNIQQQSSGIINTPGAKCIVTIDGAKYDVTDFKNIHSGGDIFTCGTDMSNIFWGQHSQRELNRMQRYGI